MNKNRIIKIRVYLESKIRQIPSAQILELNFLHDMCNSLLRKLRYGSRRKKHASTRKVIREFRKRVVERLIKLETGKEVIHFRPQHDQPYGSERKCCYHCGTMLIGPTPRWVLYEEEWNNLPSQFARCTDVAKKESQHGKT